MKHGLYSSYCKGGCRCDLCREAAREYARAYREKNTLPHGTNSKYARGCRCEPCRDAAAEYARDYRQRTHDERLAYDRERDSRDRDDPARRRARWLGWYYNREPQPCEECGAEKAHRHHDDYSKPKEVRWLCVPCHGVEHRV